MPPGYVNHRAFISEQEGGRKSPPKGFPTAAEDYGDPKNYKFPIDAKHLRAAISYYNAGGAGESGYSAAEWQTVGRRIVARANQAYGGGYTWKGGKIVPPSQKAAAEPPSPADMADQCDNPDHADLPDALHAKLHEKQADAAAKQAQEPGDADWEQEDADLSDQAIDLVNQLIARETQELGADPDEADEVATLLTIRAMLIAFQRGELLEALETLQNGDSITASEPGVGDLSVPTIGGHGGQPAKGPRGLNHYARRLKQILGSRVTDGTLDAAHKSARGYAGAMARKESTAGTARQGGVDANAARTGSETGLLPGARADVYVEPPDWIPFLPLPHTSQHPDYGPVTITRERNERFVQNFKAGVYQTELPIDAEHDLKGGGAFGFVTDMRLNADGSADAQVRWSDRGTAALQGDRFICISPEWFDEWTDKVSGETYRDVAIGGALTNRPFFKPGTLRPLAASEHLIATVFGPAREQEARMTTEIDTAGGRGLSPRSISTPNEPRSFEEQLRQLQQENAALRQASERSAVEARSAVERVEAVERAARAKRFTDEILGRSDANGTRWVLGATSTPGEDGDAVLAREVGFLERMAAQFGEDSDEFRHYVTTRRAAAETARYAGVLGAHGLPGAGEPATAQRQADAIARQYQEQDPTLSRLAALDRVFESRADLYQRIREEERRREGR